MDAGDDGLAMCCTDCGRKDVKLWVMDVQVGQPLVLYCGSCLMRIFAKAEKA